MQSLLLTIGLVGFALISVLCGLTFALAPLQRRRDAVPAQAKPASAASAENFFRAPSPAVASVSPELIDELVRRIEEHVRHEHAAAELFQRTPTHHTLHVATHSELVH